MGFGYDHNRLKERRDPTNETLDRISAQIPILITHASGHMGVLNTRAMELAGLSPDTPDPEGGHFGRENGALNGLMRRRTLLFGLQRPQGGPTPISWLGSWIERSGPISPTALPPYRKAWSRPRNGAQRRTSCRGRTSRRRTQ